MEAKSSSSQQVSRAVVSKRSSPPRPYTMLARQESVEETRLRITEAIMRLHETVGPRATTVSAIAEQAAVTRLTVYRHFPDESSLVNACSAHWAQQHPKPDPEKWLQIKDPVQRLRTALEQTYAWARPAAPMMSKIYQDLDTMPAFVGEYMMADERARVAALQPGFTARGAASRRIGAALAHALHWRTWESLCAAQGLADQDAINIMVGAVLAAQTTRAPRRPLETTKLTTDPGAG